MCWGIEAKEYMKPKNTLTWVEVVDIIYFVRNRLVGRFIVKI